MVRLRVGGLELPVEWTPGGPRVDARGEATPLGRVANAWEGRSDQLDALRRGEELRADGVYARRPGEYDDLAVERARWRRLAGSDPGDDAYLVGLTDEQGELLVPRAALVALLEDVEALRAQRPPLDGATVRELERQAQELDQLALRATTVEELARAHVRRTLLLAALADAGLLAGGPPPPELADAERLLGYADAAEQLARYAASTARRDVAEHVDPDPAVSLDWFRLRTPVPAGTDAYRWLAGWEAIFRSGKPHEGAEGFTLVREHGTWYRLEWRRDDGLRALLLRVEPVAGR
jgi:hypothetical protein